MDIQKWLDETVLPEQPPSPPDQRTLPPLLQPRENKQTRRKKRTRQRSTSDSSLLETRPQHKKTSPIEDAAGVEENACSQASHPASQSSGSSKSSQKYARRPRHKTRPDRYEPTAKEVKERGTHTHRRRRDGSKKTKRKSKSSKAEKPGTGIVQGFRAKNVPSDRLTLKPRDKLGIFNKGRASSPVKGRGLPDLVFSEMKFLQKNKDPPEGMPKAGLSKKKLKKDHAYAREEDISAYFTAVRPALVEQDVNVQAKEGSKEVNFSQELNHERDRSAGVDSVIPTVEMPDKAPYLGFGSRGPHYESGSYISWSESIRAPSVTPMITQVESAIDVCQLDKNHVIREGRDTNGEDMSHPGADSPPITRNAMDGNYGCFDMSFRVPTVHRISRSHSLPEYIYSPRPVNLINRSRKSRTTETVASPMPHRAVPVEQRPQHIHVDSAPRSPALLHSPKTSKLMRLQSDLVEIEIDNKEMDDADLPTSSSLGKILQDCNTTLNESHRAVSGYKPNGFPMDPPARRLMQKARNNVGPHGARQTISTVRFAGDGLYRPILPDFSGPGIYEQQEQRQQHRQQSGVEKYGFIDEPYESGIDELGEGGEMSNAIPEWSAALPDEARSYQFESGLLDESVAGPYEMEREEQGLGQSNDVVAKGFWRPHKLY